MPASLPTTCDYLPPVSQLVVHWEGGVKIAEPYGAHPIKLLQVNLHPPPRTLVQNLILSSQMHRFGCPSPASPPDGLRVVCFSDYCFLGIGFCTIRPRISSYSISTRRSSQFRFIQRKSHSKYPPYPSRLHPRAILQLP